MGALRAANVREILRPHEWGRGTHECVRHERLLDHFDI